MSRIVFNTLAVIAIPCVCGVVGAVLVELSCVAARRWRERRAQRAWEEEHGL